MQGKSVTHGPGSCDRSLVHLLLRLMALVEERAFRPALDGILRRASAPVAWCWSTRELSAIEVPPEHLLISVEISVSGEDLPVTAVGYGTDEEING